MAILYHHPLCPHSRFVRLVLDEYSLDAELVEERAFERRVEFLAMNPAGTTPVFFEDQVGSVPGASTIAEYLDETRGLALGERRLLPLDPRGRIEVRRLVDWFNGKMFAEVTDPLVTEKIFKRYMPQELGGGPPDMQAIRAARSNVRYHLAYIGWLMASRNWLAGDKLSYADLAAAAQLSAADYTGDVPWHENETAKNWYARMKSRPSFRSILADRVAGMEPPAHYEDLDF
jgi:glutathione S-transferase